MEETGYPHSNGGTLDAVYFSPGTRLSFIWAVDEFVSWMTVVGKLPHLPATSYFPPILPPGKNPYPERVGHGEVWPKP